MAAEVPKNNAAGRLYHLIAEAARKREDRKAKQVWAEVFGHDPADTGQILRSLAATIEQVSIAREEIARIPGANHGLFIEPLNELDNAFSRMNLEGTWKHLRVSFGGETLTKLRYTADKLAEGRTADLVPEAELHELRKQVENLIADILASSMPAELRGGLIATLERARRAIVEYHIRRAEGLQLAVDLTMGTVFRETTTKAASPPNSIINNVWGFAVRMNTVLSLASKAKSLPVPDLETLLQLPPG